MLFSVFLKPISACSLLKPMLITIAIASSSAGGPFDFFGAAAPAGWKEELKSASPMCSITQAMAASTPELLVVATALLHPSLPKPISTSWLTTLSSIWTSAGAASPSPSPLSGNSTSPGWSPLALSAVKLDGLPGGICGELLQLDEQVGGEGDQPNRLLPDGLRLDGRGVEILNFSLSSKSFKHCLSGYSWPHLFIPTQSLALCLSLYLLSLVGGHLLLVHGGLHRHRQWQPVLHSCAVLYSPAGSASHPILDHELETGEQRLGAHPNLLMVLLNLVEHVHEELLRILLS